MLKIVRMKVFRGKKLNDAHGKRDLLLEEKRRTKLPKEAVLN